MSAADHAASDFTSVCASCGIAEIDDVKLKECDNCDLVRYCSDECKKNHESEHEEVCKKRAAELRDELLFKQPESSHWGDCSICSLPLPLDPRKSSTYDCCCKFICSGCAHAIKMRKTEMGLEQSCPFCRLPLPKGKKKGDKLRMKRVKADDPVALCEVGLEEYINEDHTKAFEYYTKAADLGHMEAHFKLALLYQMGHGVEKDREKEIFHFEEAAIGGHPSARSILDGTNGKITRMLKEQ